MYALVDCNNFYASCERVFRPDLNGKPVVVLSNNDGCVIARSNEVKKLGVPMAAPAFKYEELFEKHNVHVFSANFTLYGDMSQRVMNILNEYTDNFEMYSIDEAFLKLDKCKTPDMQAYCEEIQRKVTKWTGIPISIGIAKTKSLAKVANRIAKKFPERTKNVYLIETEEQRIKALKWLKVGEVWGIGRRHAKRLTAINIQTAYDFTQLDDDWIQSKLAIVGVRLKHDLMGVETIRLELAHSKKSIATTRTFERNYTEFDQVKERVITFAVSCAEKLRKQKSCCNAMMIFIRTNNHREDHKQYNKSIVLKLPFSTSSSIELAEFAEKGLKQIFKEGYRYKKAGVVVLDFTPEENVEQHLFDNSNPKHGAAMKAIDKINGSLGKNNVKLASQDPKKTWKMRQEKLSPRYTTNIDDIITIHTR